MRKLGWFVGIVVIVIVLFNIFTFSVDETKQAIVIQYGDIRKVVTEPGLHFKLPFIQNVRMLEDRLLSYDIQPRKLITADKRRLLVNNYAIWKIREPRQFLLTMNGDVSLAQTRIDDIVYSNLRNILAAHEFNEIASPARTGMLKDVTKISEDELDQYGINLIDVRVKRADLPEANQEAVYARMQSERKQHAAQLRAEGKRLAQEIRSTADKKAQIILAEAKSKAKSIKGKGEAKALEIYSEAFSKDPDFYEFWRRLQSYEKSFGSDSSTIVLSPSSKYMRLFQGGPEVKQGSSS